MTSTPPVPMCEDSIWIRVSPQVAFARVTQLERMGELSLENTGGKWVPPATCAALNARFRGTNRAGWQRWSTTVTVDIFSPEHDFGFSVTSFGIPISHWRFTIAAENDGCRVMESWSDRRPRWLCALRIGGVRDRTTYTRTAIRHTLEELRLHLEAGR